MTKREDMPYIEDILDAINDIEKSVRGLSKEEFLANKDTKDANIRRLEIIGEAAKNLSNSLKEKYKDIEWSRIVGTRDKVIHAYSGVNLNIIWDIIKKDLAKLKKQIEKIKKELSSK